MTASRHHAKPFGFKSNLPTQPNCHYKTNHSGLGSTILVDAAKHCLGWINAALISAVVISSFLAACTHHDDEIQIRALIDAGAALAEAHNISGMLELVSEDVRAMPMNLDRQAIKAVLWRTFRYYGPLSILYPHPSVEIMDEANEASAQLPFLIVKKAQTIPNLQRLRDNPMAWIEAIGETADLYRLRLVLVKQDENWLVARAFLERFTGRGFER
jgi:hypothetical protein